MRNGKDIFPLDIDVFGKGARRGGYAEEVNATVRRGVEADAVDAGDVWGCFDAVVLSGGTRADETVESGVEDFEADLGGCRGEEGDGGVFGRGGKFGDEGGGGGCYCYLDGGGSGHVGGCEIYLGKGQRKRSRGFGLMYSFLLVELR